jgi:hypothetical protein
MKLEATDHAAHKLITNAVVLLTFASLHTVGTAPLKTCRGKQPVSMFKDDDVDSSNTSNTTTSNTTTATAAIGTFKGVSDKAPVLSLATGAGGGELACMLFHYKTVSSSCRLGMRCSVVDEIKLCCTVLHSICYHA